MKSLIRSSTLWFIAKGLGKQKEVVSGINLITLLWTDGVRCVPVDYRVFNKDRVILAS